MEATYNNKIVAAAVLGTLMLLSASLRAEEGSETTGPAIKTGYAPGDKGQDHEGLMFRATAGGGTGAYKITGRTEQLDLRQGSATDLQELNGASGFTLSLGGAIEENLIVHGTFTNFGIMDGHDDPVHDGLDIYSIGLGLTYYWMPYNVYFTGSVGPSVSLLQDGDDNYVNDAWGGQATAAIGKEWWLGDDWGLGFAVQGAYSYTSDGDVTVQGGSGMVLFSATYN
jgi:hypothetical protein